MQSHGTAASRYLRISGILAIIAATQWIIGVFIAQAYYPNYSITLNDLSDLGATCHNAIMPTPGSCAIFQPSSIIWNTVLSLLGILTMASAYMIYRGLGNRLFSTLVGLFGLGALIAGVVPENVDLTTHGLGCASLVRRRSNSCSYGLQSKTRSSLILPIPIDAVRGNLPCWIGYYAQHIVRHAGKQCHRAWRR